MDLSENLNMSVYEVLKIALLTNNKNTNTPNKSRRWTEDEEQFLKDFSHKLNVLQASNLLWRSKSSTYQRVRLLNLEEMIDKKNSRKMF